MEEQAEIENAWNSIRNSEQVQKVLAYLNLFPFRLKRTTHTALRNGYFNLTALVKRPTDARKANDAHARGSQGIRTDEEG
jgi:hypothetical protein